jgi:hypothetical protein
VLNIVHKKEKIEQNPPLKKNDDNSKLHGWWLQPVAVAGERAVPSGRVS